jgi:hypothetical protein
MSGIIYTTTTGQEPVVLGDLFGEIADLLRPAPAYAREPFCFVCNRCTDHFAEHDDLVEAGQAFYAEDGTVYSVYETWAWERAGRAIPVLA